MDVTESEGLYSLISKRGFYFKNYKGYDGLAGATVQITKNFATLGDMLGKDPLTYLGTYTDLTVVLKPLFCGHYDHAPFAW